jgi:hypothetical protein
MKRVIKPAEPELAEYSCDVTGRTCHPALTVQLRYHFGSELDGDTYDFHVCSEAERIVVLLLRLILIKGGPLEPHCVESLFPTAGIRKEHHVLRSEAKTLWRKLEQLRRKHPSNPGSARKRHR